MKGINYTLIILLFGLYTQSQVIYPFTNAENRNKLDANIAKSISKTLPLAMDVHNDEQWENALWNLQLKPIKNIAITQALKDKINKLPNTSDHIQQAFLEMAYSQYPKIWAKEIATILPSLTSNKAQCIAAWYCLNAKQKFDENIFTDNNSTNENFTQSDKQRFEIISNRIINEKKNKINQKPKNYKQILASLLSKDFAKGKTIVISLQRPNRNYPGIVIIRDTLGKLLMLNKTTLFSVAQLTRSVTNLPYFITNGNTPQGIFLMNGFANSSNSFIGPTTNIQLQLPYNESTLNEFSFGKQTDSFTVEAYKNIWPKNIDFEEMYQTYYAGVCGRTEMIAHGTTVNPEYYKSTPYYPFTPTMGCLATIELWDKNGRLVRSDQQILADAIKKAGSANGYYIVLELDDIPKPVILKDVTKYLPQIY